MDFKHVCTVLSQALCVSAGQSVFHGIQIMTGGLGMEHQHPELTSMVSKEGKLLWKTLTLESSGNILAK